MSNYLPTLKNSIKTGKIGQAKELLSRIQTRHSTEKQEILQIIALASDKTALELLSFLTSEPYKDPEIHDRLIQLITDRAHLNYSFALILFENADKQTIVHAIPLFRHILSNETDKQLLTSVIRNIGKLKLAQLVDDLAEFIFYDDINLKSDAINALERIGTLAALEKLMQASKTEKCDRDILDAIQVLEMDLKKNNAPVEHSPTPPPTSTPKKQVEKKRKFEFSDLASPSVGKRYKAFMNFQKKQINFSGVFSKSDVLEDHDLLLTLLRLVSRTIPLEVVNDLFNIIGQKKTDNTIKFAVYDALSAFPELESAASVIKGLSESAMFVRLAAIKALDKNLTDFVRAEIKNKIESGTKKGEMLAQSILDAHAKNIIEYLMISDTFSYMASNYLSKTAPIPALDTFIKILQARKLKSTAKKYIAIKEKRMSIKQDPFIVVSSSEAILSVYRKLIFSCGFSCLTFQKTQEAFEAIVFQKPRAIVCDLFLNDLTGMDLAGEVRDLYPKNEVPVIISTLQKNLDSDELEKELDSAGVNIFCEFPAKTSQIKSWVK
ncbi:MAG: hypothetical protein L3J69_16190 [Desulfobacula sp.]|nr:hypothetical protein [Desulfobacula sp.]